MDAKRDKFMDSLKGILIILVLIGHIGGDNTRSNDYLQTIEVFMYSFVMPMFVFISGYFAKNLKSDNEKSFKNLLFVYIIFQIIYGIWAVVVWHNKDFLKNPFYPGPALWYLLALFIWKKFLPDIVKIKHNFTLSIILCILSGFIPGLTTMQRCNRKNNCIFTIFLIRILYKTRTYRNY